MSNVSLHAIDQMYQSNSDDPLLMLLTLTFPNSNVFRYVNNTEDIVSNGVTYAAFPFNFTLPSDTEETVPELAITVSNIGLELIDDLTSNVSGITAEVKVVFSSVPDFEEITISDLVLKKISYNDISLGITLGYDDILNIQVPSYTYSANDYPGLLNV